MRNSYRKFTFACVLLLGTSILMASESTPTSNCAESFMMRLEPRVSRAKPILNEDSLEWIPLNDEDARLAIEMYQRGEHQEFIRKLFFYAYAKLAYHKIFSELLGSQKVSQSDLLGLAAAAILKATPRFDLNQRDKNNQPVRVKSYFFGKIRYEILQALPSYMGRTRADYNAIVVIFKTFKTLSSKLGRSPSTEELCQATGWKLPKVLKSLDASQTVGKCFLHPNFADAIYSHELKRYQEHETTSDFKLDTEDFDLDAYLENRFGEKAGLILKLRLIEKMQFADIGKRLGVSKQAIQKRFNRIREQIPEIMAAMK